MTTDIEQDLLRAMLVMAAAGLDSMVKQLIRDALSALVEIDDSVKEQLEDFVSGQILGEGNILRSSSKNFFARVLTAPSHYSQVIEEYIAYLTQGSLQSPNEIYRTAAALGLKPNELQVQKDELIDIFNIRNKIIHELDINLEAERRIRNMRGCNAMIHCTDTLFKVAENMLVLVEKKLTKPVATLPTPQVRPLRRRVRIPKQ